MQFHDVTKFTVGFTWTQTATDLNNRLCISRICEVKHASPVLFLRPHPRPLCTATQSPSHPRNITWHATQGRSMIPALFIPSVLAIRLLPFPISPLGPLSVTYIRSLGFQRDSRAIKWTANDRHSGTSPLAVSPPWECEKQLNTTKENNAGRPIRIYFSPLLPVICLCRCF